MNQGLEKMKIGVYSVYSLLLKRVLPIKASQKKNTFQEICPEKKINISHIWNKYYDPLLIV